MGLMIPQLEAARHAAVPVTAGEENQCAVQVRK
jgi:hypothetical protein